MNKDGRLGTRTCPRVRVLILTCFGSLITLLSGRHPFPGIVKAGEEVSAQHEMVDLGLSFAPLLGDLRRTAILGGMRKPPVLLATIRHGVINSNGRRGGKIK